MRSFYMNFSQARVRLVRAGVALAAAALVAGCGNNYRPVVTPVNPSGPPAQPQSFAVTVSAPSSSTQGIATIIDYSGDSVLAEAAIGLGPTAFTVNNSGTSGYTINRDHTLSTFGVSKTLQTKEVTVTTLPTTAQPVNLYSPGTLWATDLDGNVADVFSGAPLTFLRSIPLAPTPVTITGGGSSFQRFFAISQGSVSSTVACNLAPTAAPLGEVDGIDVSNSSISSRIALDRCPVFAIETPDSQRVFVLNRGSDTITVINAQTNTLDTCTGLVNQSGQPVTCHPVLPLSTTAVTQTGVTPPNGTTGMTATAGPVYAEYNAATNQLVVANYDGGTISIIDVSLDEYGNDSATFGTTYTVKVGQTSKPYPASLTVLVDGSRAYTANQADCTPDCTTSANGTVTIVNLSSHTVEKTLPVTGSPRNVVSVQNSSYGKVYVASPDSQYLTIIRTDQDIVSNTVLLQGNMVDVRVSSQNAVSGNNNNVSRIAGYGQPCNLPPAKMISTYGASYTLANCRKQP